MVRGLKILLASSSPRRIELLGQLGLEFTQVTPDVEEDESSVDPVVRVEVNARRKAMSAVTEKSLVIGADTIVVLGGRILGKPSNEENAKMMLSALSGKVHRVLTGVSLASQDEIITRHACTEVWFRTLSKVEIENYIKTGEPLDKAGAYGIQGWGGSFVERIDGSYSNVVGLPLELLVEMLRKFGFKL